jgi:hypothetical protein
MADYTPEPSAIDVISSKPIGEMTADEYKVLARQARIALHDVDQLRRQIQDGIAKCSAAASRTKALLESRPSGKKLEENGLAVRPACRLALLPRYGWCVVGMSAGI